LSYQANWELVIKLGTNLMTSSQLA